MKIERDVIWLIAGVLALQVNAYCGENPLYARAKAEQNVDRAVELYWQYFADAKGDSAFPDAAEDFAELLAENNRFSDLVRLGDTLLQLKPPPASAMNTISWALAEGDMAMEKALLCSEVGVAAQRQNLLLPPPPERSAKAWKERQSMRLGYYLDTQGYVLLKMGQAAKARDVLMEADSLIIDPDYEIYLHLALANWQLKDASEALQYAIKARYYLGDEKNADVDRIIRDAYAHLHGSNKGMEEYVNAHVQAIRQEEYSRFVADKVDTPAPDFALRTLDGGVSRLADYRGRIVLVDFWATWCGPCKRELPLLQSAYSKWKEQEVELLAISTDRDTAAVAPFIEQNKYAFPVLYNDGTAMAYDVSGIPTLYILDERGMIQYRHIGYRPDIVEILNMQIEALRQ